MRKDGKIVLSNTDDIKKYIELEECKKLTKRKNISKDEIVDLNKYISDLIKSKFTNEKSKIRM